MAIQQSKQFTKACEQWKRKIAIERATEAQLREYFSQKYEVFDAERDSLHDIGAANNAELQENLEHTQAQVSKMSAQLVAQSALATKYHLVIDTAILIQMSQTQETDDTSVSSQMTAFTAQHKQQMATMCQQLQQCQLANDGGIPPPIIDVGPGHSRGDGPGRGGRGRER